MPIHSHRYHGPTDDPIRDAERWLDDEAKKERLRPVCHGCWNAIWGEKAYEIDGELYCQNCRDDMDVDPDDVEILYTEDIMEACCYGA